MGWLGLLLSLAIFPGSAAAAGWASARAAKHPFIASFLLFVAFVAFGFQAVGYKDERDAGPIHGFLLLPPPRVLPRLLVRVNREIHLSGSLPDREPGFGNSGAFLSRREMPFDWSPG